MEMFTFFAKGDRGISAKHRTTLEITREIVKTKRGDCIVAAQSEIGLSGLSSELKAAASKEDAKITLVVESNGYSEKIVGKGSSSLTFADENEMVIRKSGYVCGRTLMIHADKAAIDLDRKLIGELRKEGSLIRVTITVE